MVQGVALWRLVFARQLALSGAAEAARISLRRTTILVMLALVVNCVVVGWAVLSFLTGN